MLDSQSLLLGICLGGIVWAVIFVLFILPWLTTHKVDVKIERRENPDNDDS